jgi:transcriptional regulator with XRE-family HTH domain
MTSVKSDTTTKLVISSDKPVYVRIVRDGGHFIKAWRKYRGLSVHDLSARVAEQNHDQSVSASMISQLEQGKAGYTQKTLELLAKALDLHTWQLLAGGPGENKDFWRAALSNTERIDYWNAISDTDKVVLEKLIRNNCEAAVGAAFASAPDIFHRRKDKL